jgi:IS5 family transposase
MASVRAKVKHPFWVIERQCGHTKVRYRGLKKNTAPMLTLFALSNTWIGRKTHLKSACLLELRPDRSGLPPLISLGFKTLNLN